MLVEWLQFVIVAILAQHSEHRLAAARGIVLKDLVAAALVPHLGRLARVRLLEIKQSSVQRLPQWFLLLLNQEVVKE